MRKIEALLESYSSLLDLRGELKDIDARIHRIKKYKQRILSEKKNEQMNREIEYWEEREACLMEQMMRYQEVINTADISIRDRRMLNMRYIDRMGWQQIAMQFGLVDEQIPRRWHRELFKNNEKNGKKEL